MPRQDSGMSNPLSVSLSTAAGSCPVRSFNEWDPLEEVIVGSLEGAVMPPSHITVTRTIPPLAAQFYRLFGGHRYPAGARRSAFRLQVVPATAGRAVALHDYRVRTGFRCCGFRSLWPRPLRHPQQRHERGRFRMVAPPSRPRRLSRSRTSAPVSHGDAYRLDLSPAGRPARFW